jgi:hypothetical protein
MSQKARTWVLCPRDNEETQAQTINLCGFFVE